MDLINRIENKILFAYAAFRWSDAGLTKRTRLQAMFLASFQSHITADARRPPGCLQRLLIFNDAGNL